MEHLQSHIPHLVQVYQPDPKMHNPQIIHIAHPTLQAHGKITYQQTITSDIHIPIPSHNELISQNQIVMSCQQPHLQAISQGQVIQAVDPTQQLQITSHMLLPTVPVFKQQILVNEVQQFYGYDYGKDQCIISKVNPAEPQPIIQVQEEKRCEPKCQPVKETSETFTHTRTRSPKPNTWASNIRKAKHQRGEAYTSRRGKYVAERQIKNTKNCMQKCIYECNKMISDEDRKMIFKSFYSLSANEKKHFILNNTERNEIKRGKTNTKRKHTFKYSFIVRSKRYTVCKNFYLGTLAISQKPVYNVHKGKSDSNIPKPDGRGLSEKSTHALPAEVKDRVRKHILSFSTRNSKPVKQFSKKKQYLQPHLNIKRMYTMYFDQCTKESVEPVKESMYRKIFKREFNLHFRKELDPVCPRCDMYIKKKK